MKYITTNDKVNEINMNDLLSAMATDDQTIEIEYLGKCGEELVADCIERIFHDDHLQWESSDEASSMAKYKLHAEIFEPVEGGIAVFDTITERDTWLNQK